VGLMSSVTVGKRCYPAARLLTRKSKQSVSSRRGGDWGPPEEVVTQTGTGEGKGEEEL